MLLDQNSKTLPFFKSVREFNFTVAKGLDVKDLNMIMVVITVNENCFPREGLKSYFKYKLATIY